MASIYEVPVDPDAGNNAHAYALGMVGFNKSVLEVGCAGGHVTRALRDRGCRVVGIEIDADVAEVAGTWAEQVLVGDLEGNEVWDRLGDGQFDAIVFGDVLEHLHDPLATLRRAVRCVQPSGVVVISLPNIAHGDVRVALLRGSFPYQDTGLLDRTHLRFFTKDSVRDLCRQAGLVIVETERVVVPLFQSELGVPRDEVAQSTIDEILEDPEAETYQFVVKAVVDNGDRAMAALADRVADLTDRAHDEVVRTALLREDLREHDALVKRVKDLERDRRKIDALLATKTMRLVSLARAVYWRTLGPGRPQTPGRAR